MVPVAISVEVGTMARLGRDRGVDLRVRQTNVKDGQIVVVSEMDFIDGAYDPEHFEIVSLASSRMVPVEGESGDVLVDDNTGGPVLRRVYDEIPDKQRDRIVRASAAERKDAHAEAEALNPQGPTVAAEPASRRVD